MREQAAWGYSQLKSILQEVPEELAWAQVTLAPGAYLHTNGTMIGMVQHMAVCKIMYGSTAFRDTEIRWSNCFDQLEVLGASWDRNLTYLEEAHQYWLSTWKDLTDADLDRQVPHFRGVLWPAWKVVAGVIHHDIYHGAQIALLGSVLTPVSVPPDLRLDDERASCRDLPGW